MRVRSQQIFTDRLILSVHSASPRETVPSDLHPRRLRQRGGDRFADVVDVVLGEFAVEGEGEQRVAGGFGVGVGAGLESEAFAVGGLEVDWPEVGAGGDSSGREI